MTTSNAQACADIPQNQALFAQAIASVVFMTISMFALVFDACFSLATSRHVCSLPFVFASLFSWLIGFFTFVFYYANRPCASWGIVRDNLYQNCTAAHHADPAMNPCNAATRLLVAGIFFFIFTLLWLVVFVCRTCIQYKLVDEVDNAFVSDDDDERPPMEPEDVTIKLLRAKYGNKLTASQLADLNNRVDPLFRKKN